MCLENNISKLVTRDESTVLISDAWGLTEDRYKELMESIQDRIKDIIISEKPLDAIKLYENYVTEEIQNENELYAFNTFLMATFANMIGHKIAEKEVMKQMLNERGGLGGLLARIGGPHGPDNNHDCADCKEPDCPSHPRDPDKSQRDVKNVPYHG